MHSWNTTAPCEWAWRWLYTAVFWAGKCSHPFGVLAVFSIALMWRCRCTLCVCLYVSVSQKGKNGGGLLRLMEPISRAIQQSDHTLPILHSPSILFPISLSPPLCCFSLNLTLIKWINQWQHQSWTDSITPLGLAACMFVHWSLVHERKNEGKTRIKSGIQMVTKDERLRAKGTSRMRERKPDTK